MKSKKFILAAVPLMFGLAAIAPVQAAPDAEAAQALMKSSGCNKCHSPDKSKSGPSLKSIGSKYKGKADAEATVVKAITTGPKVKLDDGSQEDHAIIKSKDAAQISNVAQWILSH